MSGQDFLRCTYLVFPLGLHPALALKHRIFGLLSAAALAAVTGTEQAGAVPFLVTHCLATQHLRESDCPSPLVHATYRYTLRTFQYRSPLELGRINCCFTLHIVSICTDDGAHPPDLTNFASARWQLSDLTGVAFPRCVPDR